MFRMPYLVVGSLATRPREDGAVFIQNRSPMTNRSLLLCHQVAQKRFPYLVREGGWMNNREVAVRCDNVARRGVRGTSGSTANSTGQLKDLFGPYKEKNIMHNYEVDVWM